MPGSYDADSRTITLATDWNGGQSLPVATIIHLVVTDLLVQNEFQGVHLAENIDMAVIALGLGIASAQLDLVSQTGAYWDRTSWEVLRPPFLDAQKSAYAHALAAWIRQEKAPVWATELSAETSGPMTKSLKFLFKTGDTFCDGSEKNLSGFEQSQWLEFANAKQESSQIIGLRHFHVDPDQHNTDASLQTKWAQAIVEKFRSNSNDVILHAISAIERGGIDDPQIVDELVIMAEHRDNVVKSKAILALTRLGKLTSQSMELAGRMLDSGEKMVIFAGLTALSSTDRLPAEALPALDRAFARSLSNCDQEFIALFAAGYKNWLPDPEVHFKELFEEHSPEFLEIAVETLGAIDDRVVTLE